MPLNREPWMPTDAKPPLLYLLLNEIEMCALAEGLVTASVQIQARDAARCVGWGDAENLTDAADANLELPLLSGDPERP